MTITAQIPSASTAVGTGGISRYISALHSRSEVGKWLLYRVTKNRFGKIHEICGRLTYKVL